MVKERRKSFSFQETDLEWINTLLVEWAEENEGKKQGDLITQLLKDYKKERKGAGRKSKAPEEAAEPTDKADYTARLSDALSDTSAKLKTGAEKLQGQLKQGYGQLAENIGKLEARKAAGEALEVASEKLKAGGQQVSDGLKKGYEQLLGNIKKLKEKATKEQKDEE